MAGSYSKNGKWEGKGKAVSSDDVTVRTPCPNEGTITFEKEKRSENKYLKRKEMVECSSWDSQEKIPEDHPSPAAVPNPSVKNVHEPVKFSSPPRVADQAPLVPQLGDGQDFPCSYCTKRFPSAQGLGGHQNSHKKERELAKRRNMHGYMSTHYSSSLVDAPIYPDYPLFPNRVSPGYPLFEGLGTHNGDTKSDFNSLGMECMAGSLAAPSFEAGGASSWARKFLGLSQVESTVTHEIQDTTKGYYESDGTIDLLSRVGMGNTEDAEESGDCFNQETS